MAFRLFGIKELPEPSKEEQGKVVGVSQWTTLHFKDRQMASYDQTRELPSVKHRPVTPFTWKIISLMPSWSTGIPLDKHSLYATCYTWNDWDSDGLSVGGNGGLSLQQEATPKNVCPWDLPRQKRHLWLCPQRKWTHGWQRKFYFFPSSPLIALAILLCRLGWLQTSQRTSCLPSRAD